MLKILIPVMIIFALFIFAISLSMIFKKRAHKPSCKLAGEMMGHKCSCEPKQDPKKEHECCGKHDER